MESSVFKTRTGRRRDATAGERTIKSRLFVRSAIMRGRQNRGFTLIEILIVVGILALLAALVVPRFFGAGQAARIKTVESQIGRTGAIGGSLGLYRAAMGAFPEDGEDGLMALTQVPGDEEEERKWMSGGGPFIENPEDLRDPWGNDYQYAFPGRKNDETMYDLWSYGPDGEDGTDDDIVNWLRDDDPRSGYARQ